MRLQHILLTLTALITGGGGLFLWLKLGNDAWPPALLGLLLALTCILRLLALRR